MKQCALRLMSIAAMAAIASLAIATVEGQAPAPAAKAGSTTTTGSSLKTSWGEPDLQGIWREDFQVPLQRPAKYVGREFFTDAERAELDKQRAGVSRFEIGR